MTLAFLCSNCTVRSLFRFIFEFCVYFTFFILQGPPGLAGPRGIPGPPGIKGEEVFILFGLST
jgi:hypothetical protein